MGNSMSTYTIIDEPKQGNQQKLIVNPVVILFVGIFLPLVISIPFFGRWWAPTLWLVINGWFLGSPTKNKETIIGVVGILFFPISLFFVNYLAAQSPEIFQVAVPYYNLLLQAVLFFTLYLIVGYQSAAYSLHEYFMKKGR
jgi:hypothetical protein